MWPTTSRCVLPALRVAARQSFRYSLRPVTVRNFATTPCRPVAATSRAVGTLIAGGGVALAVCAWIEHPMELESAALTETLSISGQSAGFYADPTSGVVFPKQSSLLVNGTVPTDQGQVPPTVLDLLGTGVRTVTFLSVRIYCAGFYTDVAAATKVLQNANLPEDASLDQVVGALLDAGTPVAVRIVPVRTTDFSHICGGLLRAAEARAKQLNEPEADQFEQMRAAEDLAFFKSLFAKRTKFHKRQTLDLLFQRISVGDRPTTGLTVAHDGTVLGTVVPSAQGTPITRNLALAYVSEGKVPSVPVRSS